MPIQDLFKNKAPASDDAGMVKKRKIYQLTIHGKEKVKHYEGEGLRWQVMSTLAMTGPATLDELTQKLEMDKAKVKHILLDLEADQIVAKQDNM